MLDTVKASGLFSDVSEAPTAKRRDPQYCHQQRGGAQGHAGGGGERLRHRATFFIAGSNVADYYDCTVDYVAGPTAPKITRTAHHTMITQMGLINNPPADAVRWAASRMQCS
ncbi:MAG: hypothetical protein WDM85_00115 [Caulobacteraceae bacterium]